MFASSWGPLSEVEIMILYKSNLFYYFDEPF
jgi:hypothetical protein